MAPGGLIRLSRSVVGEAEKAAVASVIDDGYLGMGPKVGEFEEAVRSYLGGGEGSCKVVCVNSGTAALHLALLAAGVGPGDEVLVQSLTYVASLQAIAATGARPVLCEVDPETCALDVVDAEAKVTERTKAVMPVHYAGRVGDIEGVYALAKTRGLRVVEDSAHAFGTSYKGNKVGAAADVACFSFDGIKNITSGEGGAVVTTDDEVARIVKDARLLGVHKETEKRYENSRSWEFDVTGQGYRYHMSNLFAALGLVQLGRLEGEFAPRRRELARRYDAAFGGLDGLAIFDGGYDEVVPHIYPVRVAGGRRDALRAGLLADGIECAVHYMPGHRLTYFGGGSAGGDEFPVTETLYGELLSIPLHPALTDGEQERVIDTIRGFFN